MGFKSVRGWILTLWTLKGGPSLQFTKSLIFLEFYNCIGVDFDIQLRAMLIKLVYIFSILNLYLLNIYHS